MERNETIQVRLSKYEKQRILNKMKSEGFSTINDWLRRKLLSDAISTERMIIDMHSKICGGMENEEGSIQG